MLSLSIVNCGFFDGLEDTEHVLVTAIMLGLHGVVFFTRLVLFDPFDSLNVLVTYFMQCGLSAFAVNYSLWCLDALVVRKQERLRALILIVSILPVKLLDWLLNSLMPCWMLEQKISDGGIFTAPIAPF